MTTPKYFSTFFKTPIYFLKFLEPIFLFNSFPIKQSKNIMDTIIKNMTELEQLFLDLGFLLGRKGSCQDKSHLKIVCHTIDRVKSKINELKNA